MGVGSALLQEGLDQADAEGSAIYLEASQEGKTIYTRRGFAIEGERCVFDSPDSEGLLAKAEGVQRIR